MRVGDGKRYRYKRGHLPFRLVDVDWKGHHWTIQYDHSGEVYRDIPAEKIVPFKGQTIDEIQQQLEEKPMLYQFKVDGKEMYGEKLAVNKAGQWVMDVKGMDQPVAVDKKECEEVIPHTISVKYQGNGKDYHFWCDEGVVEVGDYLLADNADFVVVSGVDTKSKLADKDLELKKFKRLVTEPLVKPDAEDK